MENRGHSIFNVILGILMFGGLFGIIFYIVHDDLTTIDTRVETVDGKTYDCTEANSSDNGMTYIRNPYYITMPSRNIKIIKRIK